jgi:hypothetical protein
MAVDAEFMKKKEMADAAIARARGERIEADITRLDAIEANDKIEKPDTGEDADTWKVRTLRDAYTKRPPIVYAVNGIIPTVSLIIIYGIPGGLKTFLAEDMATCIAIGKDWLNAITTKAMSVLWIDFDNGERRTDDRFMMLGRGHGAPVNAPLYYYSMPAPPLDINNKLQMDALKKRIIEVGAKVVFIDNLATVTGDIDENSAAMKTPMFNLRKLIEETGITVVVIHHKRKEVSGNGKTRAGEGIRGSTAIEGSADLALLVSRTEVDSKTVIVKSTKTRGEDVSPFAARFCFEKDSLTGETISAYFESIPLEIADAAEATTVSMERAILDALAEEGREVTQRNLVELVKAELNSSGIKKGHEKIMETAKKMVAAGRICSRKKGNSWYYSLRADEDALGEFDKQGSK